MSSLQGKGQIFGRKTEFCGFFNRGVALKTVSMLVIVGGLSACVSADPSGIAIGTATPNPEGAPVTALVSEPVIVDLLAGNTVVGDQAALQNSEPPVLQNFTEQTLATTAGGRVVAIPVQKPHEVAAVLAPEVPQPSFVQNPAPVHPPAPEVNAPQMQPLAQPLPQQLTQQVVQHPAQQLTQLPAQGAEPVAALKENPKNIVVHSPGAVAGNVVQQQATAAEISSKPPAAEVKRPQLLSRIFRRQKAATGDSRARSRLTNNRRATQQAVAPPPIGALRAVPGNTQTARNQTGLNGALPGGAMPGVRSNSAIFGVKPEKKSSSGNILLAGVSALARRSSRKLRVQHSGVDVKCIKPEIVRLISVVEKRYGKVPIVTSGYRSPSRNRKAGGVRNSLHIYCRAVDIQVEGVTKWQLAKFLRSIPGRGGVGTYCRTKSVHIDDGTKRDWNQRCRRKSKRRKA